MLKNQLSLPSFAQHFKRAARTLETSARAFCLHQTVTPIPWPPSQVGDCNDLYYLAFDPIDNPKWKPPHEQAARVHRTGATGLGKGHRQGYGSVNFVGQFEAKALSARLVIGDRLVEFGLGRVVE